MKSLVRFAETESLLRQFGSAQPIYPQSVQMAILPPFSRDLFMTAQYYMDVYFFHSPFIYSTVVEALLLIARLLLENNVFMMTDGGNTAACRLRVKTKEFLLTFVTNRPCSGILVYLYIVT